MVRGNPQSFVFIHLDIPDTLDFLRILNTQGMKEVWHGMIPFPFAIYQDEDRLHRNGIEVTIAVCTQFTVLAVHKTMFPQVVTLPADPVFLPVETKDLTIERGYQYILTELGKTGYSKIVVKLLRTIPKAIMLELPGARTVVPEALVVRLHPEILLGVNIQTLHTTLDTVLPQPHLRMAVEFLRHRVVDGIVHTLT